MEEAQRRWKDALTPLVDVEKVKAALLTDGLRTIYMPGEHRRHVFDLEDGLRVIVSRDSLNKEQYLHVSFSCSRGFVERNGGPLNAVFAAVGIVKKLGGADTDKAPDIELSSQGAYHLLWKF